MPAPESSAPYLLFQSSSAVDRAEALARSQSWSRCFDTDRSKVAQDGSITDADFDVEAELNAKMLGSISLALAPLPGARSQQRCWLDNKAIADNLVSSARLGRRWNSYSSARW